MLINKYMRLLSSIVALYLMPAFNMAYAAHNSCLDMSGRTGYTVNGEQVTLQAEKIECLLNHDGVSYDGGKSGSMRLILRAQLSNSPLANGYELGRYFLRQLDGGSAYNSISQDVAYTRPPAGTYYMYVILLEYAPGRCSLPDDYCVADSIEINQITFSSPTPPPPAATPPPDITPVTGTEIRFKGSRGYKISNDIVSFNIEKVENTRNGGTSGTLRVQLIVTKDGNADNGLNDTYTLQTFSLGQLKGGESFVDIVRSDTVENRPPSGTYYVYLLLQEFQNGEYPYVDYSKFPDKLKLTVSGGGGAFSWWSLLALFGMLTPLYIRPKQVKIN